MARWRGERATRSSLPRRGAFVLAVAFLLLFAPRPAAAAVKMKWDCYLPGTGVDCSVLEGSLVSKIPFLVSVSQASDADVVVTLSSVPAENATRYLFHFDGRSADVYATEARTTDKIPSSIDATTTMVRIMTKLERGLAEFMDQKIASEVENGTLALQLLDPTKLPFTGRPEQNGVKWFVAPSVGTYFSNVEGVGINASGNVSLSFNYSEPKWRAQQWVGGSYSEESEPVSGTNETASIHFLGANANNVLSRSISKDGKWNAGLLLAAEKNPQANYKLRANGSVGLEFDLIPRQTVNQKNLGFRCAVGPEMQHYDTTNIEGVDAQLVASQFCDAYLSWHFLPVDLWASVGEASVLKSIDYRSFSLGLSATWRVTDDFTISPWVNVQQIEKAINEAQPSNVAYMDPKAEVEASMTAAIEQAYTAPFGIQSGLSLRFLFGNGSLSSEDQRWKGASNLR